MSNLITRETLAIGNRRVTFQMSKPGKIGNPASSIASLDKLFCMGSVAAFARWAVALKSEMFKHIHLAQRLSSHGNSGNHGGKGKHISVPTLHIGQCKAHNQHIPKIPGPDGSFYVLLEHHPQKKARLKLVQEVMAYTATFPPKRGRLVTRPSSWASNQF